MTIFRANYKQILKSYNKIWEKVEKLLKIDFESKSIYGDDDKYIKTKTKIYAHNMTPNFHTFRRLQSCARKDNHKDNHCEPY